MTLLKSCCAAAAALCAFASLACDAPSVVAVPDGATATRAEMLEAQERMHAYMDAMYEYLECLETEIEDAGGEEAPADFRSAMITRYNTAVDEMETVAASYNNEVAAHHEANPEE